MLRWPWPLRVSYSKSISFAVNRLGLFVSGRLACALGSLERQKDDKSLHTKQ